MKFLPILSLILPFLPQSQATYKMVAINGAPELKDSYPFNVTTGQSWKDCLQRCLKSLESLTCHMVYLKGDICYFYFLGDFHKIRNDGSELTMANEMVAFKVDIPNGQCLGSASSTLASHTGSYELPEYMGIDITSYGISETSESYDVTYNYADECNRPYRTGIPCETCSYRMYSFRGTISMENGVSGANGPWNQCVTKCLHDATCILAASDKYLSCVLFKIETFDKFYITDNYEIDSTTANYISVKLTNTIPSKCSGVQELLLSNTMDVTSFNNGKAKSMSLMLYRNRNNEVENCPKAMMSFRGMPKLVNPIAPSSKSWKECMYECYKDSNCYMAYMKNYPDCRMAYYGNVDNIIRIEAPPTSSSALHFAAIKYVSDDITCTMNFTGLWTAGRPLKCETSASNYNYSAYQSTTSGLSSTFSWIGKNAGCIPGFTEKIPGVNGCVRAWQWDFPELEIDKSGIAWASGEPKSTNLYAILNITATTAVLISSSASQTADGELCYVPS
ncbi:hypothetical protein B9Z55_008086 [Caenorhabditis nigoni]|uniref:PAN-3 domain-containing protein n=1 Tax=Caenorhabditis nigoni TaxID=1611254 RepID=A0A2G5VD51_9PELO|nr:hypothetical protein B9Z55_008086 [Caenorhabditis nigoni]